jgi:hypothetical protein
MTARRITRAAVAASVVTTIGAATLLAGQQGSQAAGTTATDATLHFDARSLSEKFIDQGASGPSVGDSDIFSERVFERDGSRQIGRTAARCDITQVSRNSRGRVTNAVMLCVASIKLPHGTISVQGQASWTKTNTLAIVGGTGAYDRARGEFVVKDVSDTRSEYTFHIQDDNGGIIP